ncbi:MAG: YfcC family protein [Pyramidobacter sp.]|jgi:uncharacterized ion transporter superfamily protein YfcC
MNSSPKRFTMPNTWLIVAALIAVMALLSWIVPPGSFDYQRIDVNGTLRNVAVAGSYKPVAPALAHPTSFLGAFAALYDGCVKAANIIFVILCCAATFSVMVRTGAFHAGIGKILEKIGGRAPLLFPVLMLFFGVGGSAFGMLSEFYGFYPLVIGLAAGLGYDAMTGFAVLALGEYVGFMASTLNPYTIAVAQSIAEVPLYSGLGFRILCFAVFMGMAIAYVMRYAARVKRNPALSVMAGIPCVHAENVPTLGGENRFTLQHGLVLADLAVTLAVLMYGLVCHNWGYSELCALFIAMAAFAALVCGWSGNRFCDEMLAGAKSVLWGALLTGFANGLVVIMENAKIMDTIINWLSEMLKRTPSALSAQFMLIVQTLINFLIPSGSGQAAATVPIMAPLGDMLGLSRQVTCLAYQFGDGLSNLLWPTAGIVIVCGLGDIPYDRWLKWFGKLFAMLVLAQMLLLQAAVMIGL